MLLKIAEVLGVTVGFLLMETDVPQPVGAELETPVYFSEEADTAARLIDDAPPDKRREMLAVLRVMAESALSSPGAKDSNGENGGRVIYLPYHPSQENPVRDRLIQSALLSQPGEVIRS